MPGGMAARPFQIAHVSHYICISQCRSKSISIKSFEIHNSWAIFLVDILPNEKVAFSTINFLSVYTRRKYPFVKYISTPNFCLITDPAFDVASTNESKGIVAFYLL